MTERTAGMVALGASEQDVTTGPIQVSGADALTIVDDTDASIFEGRIDGRTVAGVVYSRTGDELRLLATSVFPQYRGMGLAPRLLHGVLDSIRARGERVSIGCPYVMAFVEKHPEYSDLVGSMTPVRRRG